MIARSGFMLQLTERCNMGCAYCHYKGAQADTVHGDCSLQTCDAFVDFAIRESADRLRVTFFGGEPLLRPDLVRRVIEYGRAAAARAGKKIAFRLPTNGTLLDDSTGDFLAEMDVGIVVSIDGPKEIHDACRTFHDGTGSFERVYDNLVRFRYRHPNHEVGIYSVVSGSDGVSWLRELCKALRSAYFILNPVLVPTNDDAVARDRTHQASIEALKRRFDLYTMQFLAGESSPDHDLDKWVEAFFNPRPSRNCDLGVNTTLATQNGDIYACPAFIGYPDQVVGNIHKGFYPEKLAPFLQRSVDTVKGCSRCSIRDLCGGGCAFRAFLRTHSLFRSCEEICSIQRSFFGDVRHMILALAARSPEAWLMKLCHLLATDNPLRLLAAARSTPHARDICAAMGAEAVPVARRSLPNTCGLSWEWGGPMDTAGIPQLKSGFRSRLRLVVGDSQVTAAVAQDLSGHDVVVEAVLHLHASDRSAQDHSPPDPSLIPPSSAVLEFPDAMNPSPRIDARIIIGPGELDLVGISSAVQRKGYRGVRFVVRGTREGWLDQWTDADLEVLAMAREAFFAFFMESAVQGNPFVDLSFAELVCMISAFDDPGRAVPPRQELQLVADEHTSPGPLPRGIYFAHRRNPAYPEIGAGPSQIEPEVTAVESAGCSVCLAVGLCHGLMPAEAPHRPPAVYPGRIRARYCDVLRTEVARSMIAYRLLKGRYAEKLRAMIAEI